MLENTIAFAPDQTTRELCLKWFAFIENDVDFWPFGGPVHQKRHWARVLVLALRIAAELGLSVADMEALAAASAFHDTRRMDSWIDPEHGARAAEHYRSYCDEHGLDFDPRAYLAIKWHVPHDDEGLAATKQWDDEHELDSSWRADATTILRIFKDADGLDRLRLNETALDMRYIRTEPAKQMRSFAEELLLASQDSGTWPTDSPVLQPYLVVVDVQHDFVSGALGTAEAQEALGRMVEKARNFEGRVLFTKDTHSVNYLQSQEGEHLPVEHCICGTAGWELEGEMQQVADELGAPVYLKGTFGSVELAADIEAAYARGNLASVEFIGLCTDICVASNALLAKAQMPQVPVYVDASCCAGVTPQAHEAALATMRSCQVQVR